MKPSSIRWPRSRTSAPMMANCAGPSANELNTVTERIESLLQLENKIVGTAVEKLPPLTSGKFRLTCRA